MSATPRGRGKDTVAARTPADAPVLGTAQTCDPDTCPCLDGLCTLSRVTRATAGTDRLMAGQRTLTETEHAVAERLSSITVDTAAMAAVSNIYRAASAVRGHFERTALAPHGLTWTGWVVLWVVWIWDEIEARLVAAEAGISKGTLTGVATTLENRGLLIRRQHPQDRRRVLLSLTGRGKRLMKTLFPLFNEQESAVVAPLSAGEVQVLTGSLRKIIMGIEDATGSAPGPASTR